MTVQTFTKGSTLNSLNLSLAPIKENISIELKDSILTIVGDRNGNDSKNYIVSGIAARKFRKSFSLSDAMEVRDADLKDGLLTITLEEVVPEEEQPKLIEIK